VEQLGRPLIIIGLVIAVIGTILTLGPRLPFRLGRLPLDIHIQRDNFNFYFPLGTSILISVVLTLILALVNRR
jgi:hypothetical protein